MESESYSNPQYKPFCISLAERQKVTSLANKTKVDILNEVDILLLTMPDKDITATYALKVQKYRQKFSSTKKEEIMQFYDEVNEELQLQLAQAVVATAYVDDSG